MRNKIKNKNVVIIIILLILGYSFTRSRKKDSTLELLEKSKEDDSLKLNLIYVARKSSDGKAYTTASFSDDGKGKQYTIVNVGTKENIIVFDIKNTQSEDQYIGSELFYDKKTKKIFICIKDGDNFGGDLYGYIIKGELSYNEGKWSGGGAYYAANRIGWTQQGIRQWQPAPMASDKFTISENLIKYSHDSGETQLLFPPASTQPNVPVDGSYIIATIRK